MTNPNGKGKWEGRAKKIAYSACYDECYATPAIVDEIAQALAQVEMETIERCAKVAEPYHSPECQSLCSSCSDRRNISKAIRAMGGKS